MNIVIKHLELPLSIGVFEWERETFQLVIFNVEVEVDGAGAAASDSVEDALEYGQLEQTIVDTARARHYNLLESLISEIAEAIFSRFPPALAVFIEADKPGALKTAASVSVKERFIR